MSKDTLLDQSPLPPLARGYPLLGNALAMKQNLTPFLVEQYKQLGPVFRVRALNQEFVVLAGPEGNQFVTHEGADKFRSHELWYEYDKELGTPDLLPSLDGEDRTQIRKVLKPGFSHSRFLTDISRLVDIEKKELNGIQIGKPVSALHLFREIVAKQLGQLLANYEAEDLCPFTVLFQTKYKVHIDRIWPTFMLKLPSYQRAKRRVLQMGNEIIAEHRAKTPDQNDFIDDILNASQKPECQGIFGSEEQLTITAVLPFFVGLDTVSNACTFLLYALFNHPDILTKCVAEADQLFADGLPTEAQLRAHGTLYYAMQEALRLYPIIPAIVRAAAKDFVFAGHLIKEGQQVMIATTVSHFLPELYPDPYSFDLGRYSKERREHKKPGAYAPFSLGSYVCLGAGTAEAQTVLVMATLLHLLRPKRIDPEVKLRVIYDPLATLGDALQVSFHERKRDEVEKVVPDHLTL